MRIRWKSVLSALLIPFHVSINAAVPDERLVGLWRGPVETEEWVFAFSADATVQGLIGHRTFGLRPVDDSFQYSIRRVGEISRLDVAKVPAKGQVAQAMSFAYRFLDANSLELVPIGQSESITQAGMESPRARILMLRGQLQEEIEVKSEVATFTRTGLMWQISTSERQMSWKEGQAYCKQLRIGGFLNWRLPKQSELASILDIANFRAALAAGEPPVFKPLVQPDSGYMFSGTPVPGYDDAPWILNLFNGHIFNGQGYAAYARCVRGD
jgi:hypothetical protein